MRLKTREWSLFKEANDESDEEESVITPMKSDYAWQLEQVLLSMYKLLAHRIKGLGMSLKEFWETDTWTISFLYLTELDLMEEEERQSKGKGSDPSHRNNPEVDDLMVEMGLDDD